MEYFVNSLNRSSFFVAIFIRTCIWEFDKYQPPQRQDKRICLFHMMNTLYHNLAIGLYFILKKTTTNKRMPILTNALYHKLNDVLV